MLVWHTQVPTWFFQDANGNPLTDSAADKQVLRDRLHTHIVNVAQWISSNYGAFGSATNPVVAFDVVNEVVSDSGEFADGLRRSEWYRILGEEYIDLAFQYADEAFNHTYAAAASNRPVKLFINDYNTRAGRQAGPVLRARAAAARRRRAAWTGWATSSTSASTPRSARWPPRWTGSPACRSCRP